MYLRKLSLPKPPKRSFFLWGPRQTGKTSLLESTYPDAPLISLLINRELIELKARPGVLRERILASKARFVIIDEVQKVPELLDEIHYIIEKDHVVFGLCGSSARKLKRSHANLLGGRAVRFELFGLTSSELGADFDLTQILNRGVLPAIFQAEDYQKMLQAYCADYLKEEIFDEGLVRKFAPFSQFLEFAALGDTEVLSFDFFARDVGISAPTIKSYFEILSDTLIGRFLPAYIRRPKRKIVRSPKFYFSDVGVVNTLAQRGPIRPRSELFGKAFENWVHHELCAYLSYHERPESLSYWKLHQGSEVDFIVGHMKAGIEAKASEKIHKDHLKGLRDIQRDYPELKKRYVVSLESHSRITDDNISILSVPDFTQRLWSGQLF
ncbi:AAA family ATPase [Bdellovibrionota bacterium FG-1]